MKKTCAPINFLLEPHNIAANGSKVIGNDPPKPLKILDFQQNVMGNDPPKPLKILGFQPKLMGNDPPKPLKMLGFRPKVMRYRLGF